jgi:hypothetical protein
MEIRLTMAYEYEMLVQGKSLIITTLSVSIHMYNQEPDRSLGIATGYKAGVQFLAGAKEFTLQHLHWLWGSTEPIQLLPALS